MLAARITTSKYFIATKIITLILLGIAISAEGIFIMDDDIAKMIVVPLLFVIMFMTIFEVKNKLDNG